MNDSLLDREVALRDVTERFGQGHLFAWWDRLGREERTSLLEQIQSVDFQQVRSLTDTLVQQAVPQEPAELKPAPILRVPRDDREREDARKAAQRGESLLAAGRVVPLVVAGGQGTRLGFHGPKGAFPIGPISGKSLFAFFAEKILATQTRYGPTVPWYVMTSPENDAETRRFFREQAFFGLAEDQVFFFVQGTLPAVDREGRILLASPGRLSLSPDGHGGTLPALVRSGALEHMEQRGITEISYFQVDNVLVRVLDPVFIGVHAGAGAEMSSKVLRKACPEEKVGVIGVRNGKLAVIEYSDLSRQDMVATGPDGRLKYWAGSIAMHMLQVAFIRRLHESGIRLSFHRADKRVPHIDAAGNLVCPEQPNGIKFESFIFDALEFAANPVTLEVIRSEEFSPVKNATGVNSPDSARRDLMELHASWLEEAGARVPRNPDGSLAVKIEISPRAALDLRDVRERFRPPPAVTGDLLLEEAPSR